MLTAAATGFATGLSLILVIGAQNAFVLRQGLRGSHVFWICLICGLSDAVLIAIGVAGADTIGALAPWAIDWLTWGGAAFLILYGAIAAQNALSPGRLVATAQGPNGSGRTTILTCLALTWLNPHVYLDTVGLIGAVSTGFSENSAKLAFGGGAIAASFVFFFGLGYGARLLAPTLARPRAWAVLDGAVALLMWTIAATLIAGELG